MRGKARGIDQRKIDVDLAKRLHHVAVQQHAARTTDFGNLAHRLDDVLIDDLAGKGIAFVPFFPLGGFRPLQSPILDETAAALGATTRQVALAWLLQRAPNILLIPGTSSVAHLRENVAAAALTLSENELSELDGIAS